MLLIDRLNMHFKSSYIESDIDFTSAELDIVDRMKNLETFEDVKKLAKELGFSEFIEKMSFRFIPVRLSQRHAEELSQYNEWKMIEEMEKEERAKTGNLTDPNSGRVKHDSGEGSVLQGNSKRIKKMGGIVEHKINIPAEPEFRHPNREMLAKMRAPEIKGKKGKDPWKDDIIVAMVVGPVPPEG